MAGSTEVQSPLKIRVIKTWCELVSGTRKNFLRFVVVCNGQQTGDCPMEGDFANLKVGDEIEVKLPK